MYYPHRSLWKSFQHRSFYANRCHKLVFDGHFNQGIYPTKNLTLWKVNNLIIQIIIPWTNCTLLKEHWAVAVIQWDPRNEESYPSNTSILKLGAIVIWVSIFWFFLHVFQVMRVKTRDVMCGLKLLTLHSILTGLSLTGRASDFPSDYYKRGPMVTFKRKRQKKNRTKRNSLSCLIPWVLDVFTRQLEILLTTLLLSVMLCFKLREFEWFLRSLVQTYWYLYNTLTLSYGDTWIETKAVVLWSCDIG